MNTIARPGINQRWAKSGKKWAKQLLDCIDELDPRTIKELTHYANTGARLTLDRLPVSPGDVPQAVWEGNVRKDLVRYADQRLIELAHEAVNSDRFNNTLAMKAFVAQYISQMTLLAWHEKFRSFKGRTLQVMNVTDVPYTALGIVIGCREEALKLARMQLMAYRRSHYYPLVYPIFHFMLRILADYLQEPPHVPMDEDSYKEPILNALFSHWRDPDVGELTEICLAVCDLHTQRCVDTKDELCEFDNSSWTHIPIEILLMFRLRQWLGLPNPVLDHPLMSKAFSTLPPEASFAPDELISRVRERMRQQGYDEAQIYEQCYTKLK